VASLTNGRRQATRTRLAAIGAIAVLCALVVGGPSIALAHERRTVGSGKYDVVVGWDAEPPYVGQKNTAAIRISRAGTNPAEPVIGAEKSLKIDIRQGATTKSFALHAIFGQPGYYGADIVPTRAGDYVWTFSGSIADDQINEVFDSADGKFDSVQAASDLEFPLAAPDPAQVTAELQDARGQAQSAQVLGWAGQGVGVLALLAAGGLWLTRPRGRR
jgi:hypothetical protein